MRKITGTMAAVLAAGALAGFAAAGLSDGSQTYRATVERAPLQGASAGLQVEDGDAVLVAENLPEPPEGQAYQAWIKRSGVESPEPSVLFSPGEGSASVAVPADAAAVLVTREPKRGSSVPSEPPLLTVDLS
jgi:hypothetical protein